MASTMVETMHNHHALHSPSTMIRNEEALATSQDDPASAAPPVSPKTPARAASDGHNTLSLDNKLNNNSTAPVSSSTGAPSSDGHSARQGGGALMSPSSKVVQHTSVLRPVVPSRSSSIRVSPKYINGALVQERMATSINHKLEAMGSGQSNQPSGLGLMGLSNADAGQTSPTGQDLPLSPSSPFMPPIPANLAPEGLSSPRLSAPLMTSKSMSSTTARRGSGTTSPWLPGDQSPNGYRRGSLGASATDLLRSPSKRDAAGTSPLNGYRSPLSPTAMVPDDSGRRPSVSTVSSVSTFRVRRKPAPSEDGVEPMSPTMPSSSYMSPSISGNNELPTEAGRSPPLSTVEPSSSKGYIANPRNNWASYKMAKELSVQEADEAGTPQPGSPIAASKYLEPETDADKIKAAATAAPMIMVDGQAFTLGGEEPSVNRSSKDAGPSETKDKSSTVDSSLKASKKPAYQWHMKEGGLGRRIPDDDNGFSKATDGSKAVPIKDADGKAKNEVVPAGSYAIHPPSDAALEQAADCDVYDEDQQKVRFGDLFAQRRVLVCFLRHWFCPMCQEFAMSMKSIDPLPLQRAELSLIVVGQGHPHVVASYKRVMGVPEWISMYADPTRKIYAALGMTMRTNDPGPACAKPDYITMSMMKGSMAAIKKGLFEMPIRAPGDLKLLGGDFILGPGNNCSFTHRMVTTRGHLDLPRILTQAGCDMTLKSEPKPGQGRPESTHSAGGARRRRRKQKANGARSVKQAARTLDQERGEGKPKRARASADVPAVPKIPLAALFKTGIDGRPLDDRKVEKSANANRPQTAPFQGSTATEDVPRRAAASMDGRRLTASPPGPLRRASSDEQREIVAQELRDHQRRTFAQGPAHTPESVKERQRTVSLRGKRGPVSHRSTDSPTVSRSGSLAKKGDRALRPTALAAREADEDQSLTDDPRSALTRVSLEREPSLQVRQAAQAKRPELVAPTVAPSAAAGLVAAESVVNSSGAASPATPGNNDSTTDLGAPDLFFTPPMASSSSFTSHKANRKEGIPLSAFQKRLLGGSNARPSSSGSGTESGPRGAASTTAPVEETEYSAPRLHEARHATILSAPGQDGESDSSGSLTSDSGPEEEEQTVEPRSVSPSGQLRLSDRHLEDLEAVEARKHSIDLASHHHHQRSANNRESSFLAQAPANGAGGSFLDDLDILDSFTQQAIPVSQTRSSVNRSSTSASPPPTRQQRRRGQAAHLSEDEEERRAAYHNHRDSMMSNQTDEVADSDSEMEHEVGWIRPSSSAALSRTSRGGSSRGGLRHGMERESIDSDGFPNVNGARPSQDSMASTGYTDSISGTETDSRPSGQYDEEEDDESYLDDSQASSRRSESFDEDGATDDDEQAEVTSTIHGHSSSNGINGLGLLDSSTNEGQDNDDDGILASHLGHRFDAEDAILEEPEEEEAEKTSKRNTPLMRDGKELPRVPSSMSS